MAHAISWFEIPASNFARAIKFYEKILGKKLKVMGIGKSQVAMFPGNVKKEICGGIVAGPAYKPSRNGALVYLNAGLDLNKILKRVKTAGGKLVDKKYSCDPGFIGTFIDSEGNKIGLFSPN